MHYSRFLFSLLILLQSASSVAQAKPQQDSTKITLPASDHYYKNKTYKYLWGEHYRKEWHEPVSFQKVYLDTLAGGLIPYQTGGGRQTKSIRLHDKNNREYVLRSIDKSFGEAVPDIVKNTFIESFVNDQVTIAHPYASVIVAPLADAARIFHANPALYYLPAQKSLKQFNQEFGNRTYLFEQRPDEDWSVAANFGNAKKIIGTDKMLEKLLKDNDNAVDQKAFIKARLFDMLIGDWGRHDDQWRWASFEQGKKTTYVPIPRDRDNAFSVFDGALLKTAIMAAHAKHLQSFDDKLKNVKTFNFPARNMDRHLLNELTLQDWLNAANDLKHDLTDEVIDNAVKQLPPEVYPISGPGIAAKLKSRREKLDIYAKEYFLFISHEVEITGTEDDELFEVNRLSDTETRINIYKIGKKKGAKDKPFYSRIFNNTETKEVRIYGINGKDEYKVDGNVNKSIKLRLIGGPGEDKYEDQSAIKRNGKRTLIYDDHKNEIKKSGETKLHLSNDSAVHRYVYEYYKPNKRSMKPTVFYSNEDRIFVGYSYLYQKQQWRHQPFGLQHKLDIKYSLSQKAFSSTYSSIFDSVLHGWDLFLYMNADQERWTNFYGLGNETVMTTKDRDYNRVRSRQFIAKAGLQRVYNNRHKFIVNPLFQVYDVVNDTARFLAKTPALNNDRTYFTRQYAGAEMHYVYQSLDDSILPLKGFNFMLSALFTHNINQGGRDVGKYSAESSLFIPLVNKFHLFVKAAGSTLTGNPEFYQYNMIASSESIRGYRRDRFYGKSTFINQNELRWISNVRSHLFNGKIGIFGLYDVGRVWIDGEKSNTWHGSYGAGIILSPFNAITVSAAYAVSADDTNIHLRLMKIL